MRLADHSLNDFTELLASKAPTPGGGAAAALCGALGAALAHMVGALTAGKAKYAEHEGFVEAMNERAREICRSFLELIDEDAKMFGAMSGVYKMPKETDAEKAERKAAMQAALKNCAEPPLAMMELCVQALELTDGAIGKTNVNVASDLGVAAACPFVFFF